MTRVLVVSHEPVGERLAGPALRALELSRVLAQRHHVTLAVPLTSGTIDAPVEVRPAGLGEIASLAGEHDLTVVSGLTYNFAAGLTALDRPIVVDAFIPFLLEELQARSAASLDDQASHHEALRNATWEQLAGGDFFLCASEKQRDYWLGGLAMAGRLNPANYAADTTLRSLIDVVPFGLPAAPPEAIPGVLKGPGAPFAAGDQVLYWGGGLYDWFDPDTLIRALHLLHQRGHRNVKLFFAGVRHPNPDVGEMRVVRESRRLVAELGLDGSVVFNDWIPFERRGAYLIEADAGISLHLDHVETRFSFRTRLMDYLWGGLPMVLSAGDTLGADFEAAGLARTVAERDVEGTAAAIEWALEDDRRDELAAAFRTLRGRYTWEAVAGPLVSFCDAPHRAADRPRRGAASALTGGGRFGKVARRMAKGQFSGLVEDARAYVRWRRQR